MNLKFSPAVFNQKIFWLIKGIFQLAISFPMKWYTFHKQNGIIILLSVERVQIRLVLLSLENFLKKYLRS
jgi:hypothetical protein